MEASKIGSVHKDIYKTEVTHDVIHAYTDAGIAQLLSDVYKLANDAQWRGDVEAIVLRVDLERALRSRCMSPKQRQAVALYYFAQLTQEECAKMLGVTHKAVGARLTNAVANIAAHMQGDDSASPQYIRHDDYTDIGHEFDMWMAQVLVGHNEWWGVNADVLDTLNRVLGMPQKSEQSNDDGTEYPYLTDGQMRGRNRNREILRPEVYPTDWNRGYVVSSEDGKRIRL